ncbi:MAG: zinc-dependent alcohol dehydrogenase family protein [Devosia sp.]|nr:zinc-dependent alcohol dehydrogenase family protein [Devosia sp.]
MRAMRLHRVGSPLVPDDMPVPVPQPGELLIEVTACGVCRTDLHIVDGDLPAHRLPLVPGHEIVGIVAAAAEGFALGTRVGVPWLGGTCGECSYCRAGQENLCDRPQFTGYDRDGGYAEFCVARAANCIRLPPGGDDAHLAPLLCAGLIGFRSYRRAGAPRRLGLIGFGAAAHIITQVARADGVSVYAFTRPGDASGQAFARGLGAIWAGGTNERPPEELDAIIIFAPAGELVPRALQLVRKGGRVVCAGIHMSDIPAFAYADLWGEREIASVANLTTADATGFFARLKSMHVETTVTTYRLDAANQALADLRAGSINGAAVLVPRLP